MERIYSPDGEEFTVAEETANRILNYGVPFIIVDIKEQKLTIKENDLFLYTNLEGMITSGNTSGLGLYAKDTRYLNLYEIKVNGRDMILLSSTADRDYQMHVEMTNTDIWEGDKLLVPQETLNMRWVRVISDSLLERMRIKNYNAFPVELDLELFFAADFADIFEVRGQRRLHRGRLLNPKYEDKSLRLAYLGEDGRFRQTRISLSESPDEVRPVLEKVSVVYKIKIPPHGRFVLNVEVAPLIDNEQSSAADFNNVDAALRTSYQKWEMSSADIYTDNELFNSMLNRGRSDLRALSNETTNGARIYDAGIPWFVATFGRDSMWTTMQSMILNSDMAAGCLSFLGSLQGKEMNDWRDEEPGKILHEIREGELALTGEIPHTPYYGSIDSTPLFIILLSEYWKWTADEKLLQDLRPNLEAALKWIDDYGDLDGDLLVEYLRRSPRGLHNQGWKDSFNAVAHVDGRLAAPPIALSEVQGYIYAAKKRAAEIYRHWKEPERADQLDKEAEAVKKKVDELFWMEDQGYYCIALDGAKNQVASVSSNPGQLLWSGMLDQDRAGKVKDRLFMPDMHSGWGIRTLSKASSYYNPMSYHNGSVWPHDNAIIAKGLKQYGFSEEVNQIATDLFDAAMHFTYYRLPELFCGFTRRSGNRPVGYPVACSPQAWSAGTGFLLLQAMLGITPDAPNGILYINNPTLPSWINKVLISRLKVGDTEIDISFTREKEVTSFTVLRKTGKLRIVMEE